MNAMLNFEQRIKNKLAELQGEIQSQRNHLGQKMAEVDHRHEQYTVLADRLTSEIIRPRM